MSTFLTVAEVAARLRVSTRTVQRWQEENVIAFVKVNGVVRISEEHLQNWIDKKTIKAQKKIA
jgi:excisionase family DNA binding protein